MKKPEAGEWWYARLINQRLFCCGYDSRGYAVFEINRDIDRHSCVKPSDFCRLEHLPECTGWDWTPPDWVTQDRTHIRAGDWYRVGGFVVWDKAHIDLRTRRHGVDGYEVRCLREELPPMPQKPPEAGEWWRANNLDSVVLVHGVTKTGVVLYEHDTGGWGHGTTKDFLSWYTHLPECTGWE